MMNFVSKGRSPSPNKTKVTDTNARFLFFIDPCKATRCPYYSICLPHPNSELGYKCVCPSGCSKAISQVCGSDGRTYDNECVMQQESCSSKTMITLVKLGTCGK